MLMRKPPTGHQADMAKLAIFKQYFAISQKWCKIGIGP